MYLLDSVRSTDFKCLYKNKQELGKRQAQRRENLLKQQKDQRNQICDMNRFLNLRRDRKNNHQHNNHHFANKIQLSDWFVEKPNDIENWLLVPCPKGKRCLIVARDGYTTAYSKNGYCFKKFRSSLPGDETLSTSITILDAIFDMHSKTFYVLDVLSYGYQEMLNCEASFRFFWHTSKTHELELDQIRNSNTYSIVSLEFFDLACEPDELMDCLAKTNIFMKPSTDLDGILFYHKEASYTHGVTPLVGWLYPFMLEEVMSMRFQCERYNKKPTDYVNYLDYIEIFNKNQTKLLEKRQNNRVQKNSSMDFDNISAESIIEQEKNLEMEVTDETFSSPCNNLKVSMSS